MAAQDCVRRLETDAKAGLSRAQAERRLREAGRNELTGGKRRGPAARFFSQFTDFMCWCCWRRRGFRLRPRGWRETGTGWTRDDPADRGDQRGGGRGPGGTRGARHGSAAPHEQSEGACGARRARAADRRGAAGAGGRGAAHGGGRRARGPAPDRDERPAGRGKARSRARACGGEGRGPPCSRRTHRPATAEHDLFTGGGSRRAAAWAW